MGDALWNSDPRRARSGQCIAFGQVAVFALATGSNVGFAAEPPVTSERDVMAPVQQLVDAANKGDETRVLAAYASPAFILDGFPPYAWQGTNAAADWWNDWQAYSKKSGISHAVLTVGKPQQLKVTGERAYAVVPASIETTRGGKVTESSGTLTVALQKVGGHWVMSGWAWTH